MRRVVSWLLWWAAVVSCGCTAGADEEVRRGTVPPRAPVVLSRVGTLDPNRVPESSGLVRSPRHPGLFWTHNDSGGGARLFPVHFETDAGPARVGDGVWIPGARNVDWEDIAADDTGNLLIGDVGNNRNLRRDLVVYVVPEPAPTASRAEPAQRIPVHYPDQRSFPPARRNYDAEALFWSRGGIYLLTKHRSDTHTRLYRLDSRDADRSNPLTLVGEFDVGGMVTAADTSPDGRQLAVLTYGAVWLFEVEGGDDFFAGTVRWLPIRAGQCEAICFDGERLLIGNEAGTVYALELHRLVPVAG